MQKQTDPPKGDDHIEEAALEHTLSRPPTLTLDVEKYQHYLDESDLSENQKQDFLESLWLYMVSFVELGYGVHPLQKTGSVSACGQNEISSTAKLAFDSTAMVTSNPDSTENQTEKEPVTMNVQKEKES